MRVVKGLDAANGGERSRLLGERNWFVLLTLIELPIVLFWLCCTSVKFCVIITENLTSDKNSKILFSYVLNNLINTRLFFFIIKENCCDNIRDHIWVIFRSQFFEKNFGSPAFSYVCIQLNVWLKDNFNCRGGNTHEMGARSLHEGGCLFEVVKCPRLNICSTYIKSVSTFLLVKPVFGSDLGKLLTN